jgi:hypothetical protein
LILWSYALESILPLYKDFDEKLVKHIWRTRKVARRSTFIPPPTATSTSAAPSASGSQAELNEKIPGESDQENTVTLPVPVPVPAKRNWWSWRLQPAASGAGASDPEKGSSGRKKPRKLILLGPLYAGCGAALAMCTYINLLNAAQLSG